MESLRLIAEKVASRPPLNHPSKSGSTSVPPLGRTAGFALSELSSLEPSSNQATPRSSMHSTPRDPLSTTRSDSFSIEPSPRHDSFSCPGKGTSFKNCSTTFPVDLSELPSPRSFDSASSSSLQSSPRGEVNTTESSTNPFAPKSTIPANAPLKRPKPVPRGKRVIAEDSVLVFSGQADSFEQNFASNKNLPQVKTHYKTSGGKLSSSMKSTLKQRYCKVCGQFETTQFRKGPDGKMSLCNACGLHWKDMQKKESEQARSYQKRSLSFGDLLN